MHAHFGSNLHKVNKINTSKALLNSVTSPLTGINKSDTVFTASIVPNTSSFSNSSQTTGTVNYVWDFGDGSSSVNGKVEGTNTTAEAIHEYKDYRPYPYTATLTVKGNSELGEVESQAMVSVFVTESKGWVGGGIDIVDTVKTVVRSLSIVANWLLVLVFWIAIFSPLWIGGIALGWFLWKRFRRVKH